MNIVPAWQPIVSATAVLLLPGIVLQAARVCYSLFAVSRLLLLYFACCMVTLYYNSSKLPSFLCMVSWAKVPDMAFKSTAAKLQSALLGG